MSKSSSCSCHSGRPYSQCCQPFHRGERVPNAERLMRSRYSAYALGLVSYIMETTHPENPHFSEDQEAWGIQLEAFTKNTSFDGLDILDVLDGEEEAFVTFRAKLRQNGQDASFIERSRFIKVDGRWYYHSGEFPASGY